MSQPIRLLLSLVVGLVGGVLLGRFDAGAADVAVLVAQPVGTAWLNGLQMTVVPLVLSLLVTGVASTAEAASAGRLAARTIGLALVFLTVAATAAAVAMIALLDLLPIPVEAARQLRAAITGDVPVPTPPPLAELLAAIVPTNVVGAAASGALLSLIVFTLVFAFALTRIEAGARDLLVRFFAGIRDTMLVVVGWVLWLAPLGVFALALAVGARAGAAAFGALVHYIALVCVTGLVVVAIAYVLTAVAGRVPIGRFARAALPAQTFAVSTASSLASLPAMLKAAGEMGVSGSAAGVVLPLIVAMFRATQPAMNLAIAIYIGAWFGVATPPAAIAAGIAVGVITSLGSVSLPSQITFFASVAPIASAMGVPLTPLGLLLAVETIPDIFRTLGNVTSDLALTTVVTRGEPADE
ncbi:dicarboxylate/amino acid:cation symporter [Sphingomonas rubra]|uniref:Na+/H+-dicarboxylate symporter n=1 Tax=Sphingomonas rubra TaxID=634430 RepID=A0A1I5SH53_9SPHN|nr:cation:dicarboxylase symporter family transporter [Sphingomonas rubra]SFP70072.1 Na+/H+-dicarboxylate symporter [Sphingomonas rubra]